MGVPDGYWFPPIHAGTRYPAVARCAWVAIPICLRLLVHLVRAAASRTFWTAGRSSPIRTAMMAITTSSSIRVNPDRRERAERRMEHLRHGGPIGPGNEKKERGCGPDGARRRPNVAI